MDFLVTPTKRPKDVQKVASTDEKVLSTDKKWKVDKVDVTPPKSPPLLNNWLNHVPPEEPVKPLHPPIVFNDWKGLPHAHSGLTNLHNTCFISSVIQAIFHVPPFVKWLHSHEKCSSMFCITCGLKNLMVK
ncbi:uncharacterized protein LOC117647826 [Thrips palmi]|uniref:Uncharacterized protein LOC117647826 n=1 Tax=Thrips palmi TaxID=161013 RepID=A0A6P8YZT4_THRPL|nr:uncharacterized protein LOC117647826 [Thrips palmi]